MPEHLFSTEPADTRVNDIRADVAATINRHDNPHTLVHQRDQFVQAGLVERCSIARTGTTFEPTDTGTEIKVVVTIPVTGDPEFLRLRVPLQTGDNTLVRARFVQDHPYAEGRQIGPRVEIEETFPPGTTGDEVRAKVRPAVEAIEANLAKTNAFIDEHNDNWPGEVDRLIEHRRQVLETGISLRNDLGPGI